MTAQEQIKSLLQQWIASTRTGKPIPVAELCRDHPDLLLEVKNRIEQMIAEAKARKEASRTNETSERLSSPSAEGTHVQKAPSFASMPTQTNDGYPESLGGYTLGKVLGEGGMGRVYEGLDARLNRKIAVKVMRPDVAANPDNRERFLREARAAAALEQDHIITIHQVGEENGIPFLIMPFLKGEPLESRLKRIGSLPAKEVLRISREMAEGLATAHEAGLVHRDIKPANVWLEGDRARVKILDFGLARGQEGDKELTQSGTVMGTPAYMAPEQANGEKVDSRADLFSLGCVMYQMARGQRPFDGASAFAILTSLATHHPPSLSDFDLGVPVGLSKLIDRLLSKKAADRPKNTWDVVTELRRLEDELAGKTVAPVLAPQPAPLPTPVSAASDPWASIEEDTEVVAPPPKPKPKPDSHRPAKKTKLIAFGLGGFLLLLVSFIVIKITNKDGSVSELKVPEGTGIEIIDNGKSIAKLEPNPKAEPKPKIDPKPNDEQAAADLPPLPKFAFTPIPVAQSPFDKLDANEIPKAERFDWQPKELVAVIGQHERRHWGGAWVAISPDGKWAATASGVDHFLFDLTTRKQVQAIRMPGDRQFWHGFSPDGGAIWIANQAGIQACKLGDSQFIPVPEFARTPEFRHLSLSGDRKLLLLFGPRMQVWDVDGPKLSLRKTVDSPGHHLGFSADGQSAYFATRKADGQPWEIAQLALAKGDDTRKLTMTFPPDHGPLWNFDGSAMLVSPDGKTLAVLDKSGWSDDGSLFDLTVAPPKEKARFKWDGPAEGAILFSPDSKRLFRRYTSIQRLDVSTDLPRKLAPVVVARQGGFAEAPDGKTMVVNDGLFVRFFDVSEEKPKELDPLRSPVLSSSPSYANGNIGPLLTPGKGLIVVPESQHSRFWDLTGTKPRLWPNPEQSTFGDLGPAVAGVSPDGERLVTYVGLNEQREAKWTPEGYRIATERAKLWFPRNWFTENGFAYCPVENKPPLLWNLAEPPEKGRSLLDISVEWRGTFAVRSDGSLLVVSNWRDVNPQLEFWNLTGDKPRKVASLPGRHYSVQISPDGRWLVACCPHTNPAAVYDLSGKQPRRVPQFGDDFRADWATFGPDGKTVYVGGDYRDLAGYDLANGKQVWGAKLPGPSHWLQMAPDGRHLFTHNANGTVYVLRLK